MPVGTPEELAAACEVFAERGYGDAELEQIAERAGIAPAELERRYPRGKDELFGAVVVRLSAETAQRVRGAAGEGATPLQSLERGIDAFLDAAVEPAVRRVLLLDAPAVLGTEVWQALEGEYGLELIDGALQRAVEAGELPPQSTRAAARVLLGALEEAAMSIAGVSAGEVIAARAEGGAAVRRLVQGLRAPLR